jgi:phage-related protein
LEKERSAQGEVEDKFQQYDPYPYIVIKPHSIGTITYLTSDNPNTTQTLEYTKDKYNVKIIKRKVSPKVSPTTYVGRRIKERRCEGDERVIAIKM